MVDWCAVLRTSTSGGRRGGVAREVSLVSPPASLLELTVAVLGRVPVKVLALASAPLVGLVRCTLSLAPAGRVVPAAVSDRTWWPMAPVMVKSAGLPVLVSMVQKT